MLVLSRFLHERIQIGDDIVITIADITKDSSGRFKVRIGIDAPKDIPIAKVEILSRPNGGIKSPVDEST